MEFKKQNAIYHQIAELLCDRIMAGEWTEEDRIASIREVAAQLGVNPNTVMRTYDYLQQNNIVYNQRGVGYFVSAGAKKTILQMRRKEFVEEVWPVVRQRIEDLGLDINELMS